MGRLPGDSPEASLFQVPLRLRASLAPPAAPLGKLQPLTATVETKFDLQRPFLSGLGSICDFSGFLGGHGVGSRLRLENRALEAVWRHTFRNPSLRA